MVVEYKDCLDHDGEESSADAQSNHLETQTKLNQSIAVNNNSVAIRMRYLNQNSNFGTISLSFGRLKRKKTSRLIGQLLSPPKYFLSLEHKQTGTRLDVTDRNKFSGGMRRVVEVEHVRQSRILCG